MFFLNEISIFGLAYGDEKKRAKSPRFLLFRPKQGFLFIHFYTNKG